MFKFVFISLLLFQSAAINLEKDILEKSQNLILQKDRLKAVTLINNILKTESLDKKQKKQAVDALGVYSRLFLEEKTQLTFEHGLSLINSDLDKAIQKIQEAKQSEPLNLTVGLALAKALLLKKQCKEAYEGLSIYVKTYELDQELLELMETAALCTLDRSLLKDFLEAYSEVHLVAEKLYRLEGKDPKVRKALSLGWTHWFLSLNTENLSQKDHEFLIKQYQASCPKELEPKEDQLEKWLFCGQQDEFETVFAKKFKIKEKNKN